MGISPFKNSGCTCGKDMPKIELPRVRMPDPRKFELREHYVAGRWLVVSVRYPDAGNFEGLKILVFHDVALETLQSLDFLDPHFCESAHISPVARFRPDPSGWDCAVAFVRMMAAEGL